MKKKINAVMKIFRKINSSSSLALAVCLLCGVVGYTTTASPRSPAPRPVVLNVPLGTIGVVATSTVSWFDYQRPRQRGRTDDAPKWAERGFFLGGNREDCQGVGQAIAASGPAGGLLAASMLAGGVLGRLAGDAHDLWNGLTGIPQEKLAPADVSLYKFIMDTPFQEVLRSSVGAEAKRRTSLRVTVVKKPFPEGQEKEFSKLNCVMAGTLAWLPQGQNPRTYLEDHAIDTVLEIRIHEHSMKGKRGSNPDLRLLADVEARLVRLQDGAELCSHRILYQSTARKYTDWTENNAHALRSEFAACCQSMAQQIVGGLLPVQNDFLAASHSQSGAVLPTQRLVP